MKMFASLVWGNVSIYNRFGHKSCTVAGCTASGTSLALMKKLMVSQLVYGVSLFGFEGALVDSSSGSEKVTPVGKLQQLGKKIAEEILSPDLGCTHLPTVAVVLDVESGWTPAGIRPESSRDLARIWPESGRPGSGRDPAGFRSDGSDGRSDGSDGLDRRSDGSDGLRKHL